MGWANEFVSLTNAIFNEHQERDSHIRQLKGDIKQKRNDWNASRAQMKTELLTNFKEWDKARVKDVADIRSAAQAFLAELNERDKVRAKEANDLKAAVQTYLKKFRDEDIAGFKKENKERAQQIAKFKVDVGKMISEFKKEQDQAAAAWKELIAGLAKGEEKKAPVKKEESKAKTTSEAKKV
jgi:hypothetical protein